MPSWKDQITSGFREFTEGVGGMIEAGADKAINVVEGAVDKAADFAERAVDKLDQLAAQLLDGVETERIVHKRHLLDFARREDNDFNANLAGRLWNRLTQPGFQARMAKVGCVLRDADGGFYVSDLGKVVTALKRPDIDIIQIGDKTIELLEAFVAAH